MLGSKGAGEIAPNSPAYGAITMYSHITQLLFAVC